MTIKQILIDNQRKPNAINTFAIDWISCFVDSFVVKKSLDPRINLSAEKLVHSKCAIRWQQGLGGSANSKLNS